MSIDEDFARALRARVQGAVPVIDVDTSRVVSGARRRRVARRIAATVVLSGALVVTTVVAVEHWSVRGASMQPAASAGASRPAVTTSSDDAGWPDAPYWHSAFTYDVAGTTHRGESWRSRTGEGILISDGNAGAASTIRPWFGQVFSDDTFTDIDWHMLYTLPTDPVALDKILRADPPGGALTSSADDRVFRKLVTLADSPAPPPLKRAVWAAASRLAGTTSTTDATDSQGRPGTRVQRATDTFIFDPEDGHLLELTTPSMHIVYLEQGPADSAPPR